VVIVLTIGHGKNIEKGGEQLLRGNNTDELGGGKEFCHSRWGEEGRLKSSFKGGGSVERRWEGGKVLISHSHQKTHDNVKQEDVQC